MSNSSLVDITILSPNHSGARTHAIDRITPHCIVGQWTARQTGQYMQDPGIRASCNYGIGKDGDVVLVVPEAYRSWCSSSNANDQRAVTIECASDKTEPYAFNDKVYAKLVDLCEDICRRNGKAKLIWIEDKDKALAYAPASDEMLLTVHRWLANKSCPGTWMFSRMGKLASEVTERLAGNGVEPYTVRVTVSNLNYRTGPGKSYPVKGQTGEGIFTIVAESDDWGKLKSGAGWIYIGNKSWVERLDNTDGKEIALDENDRADIEEKIRTAWWERHIAAAKEAIKAEEAKVEYKPASDIDAAALDLVKAAVRGKMK